MRNFAMIGIITAVVAVVSASLVAANHKKSEPQTSAVDPTEITLMARALPVMQVDEPF